jgi:branched-chain amino acid aminotransferase
MICWLDGRLVAESHASISIDDRGFLYGDGVFETALLRDGGFFRLREHLLRFAASAAAMRIPAPDTAALDGIVRDVVRAGELQHASIRITLTRGARAPVLLVTARPPDPRWQERARRGWRIITADTRRPSVAAVPAQLKALGRTWGLIARHEATEAGADDALLLDDAGIICEGPAWNVFWRVGATLHTPSLDAGVLAGVTRSTLLELAPALGFTVREGLFERHCLDAADEIFASLTSVGIVSIRELDGRRLPDLTPAADALLPRYDDVVAAAVACDPA